MSSPDAPISAAEGALQKGADAVADAKMQIEGEVKKVRSEIEQVSGYWGGSAQAAFAGLMSTWDQKTSELTKSLDVLIDGILGTQSDQAATEQEHQDTIRNLMGQMNA